MRERNRKQPRGQRDMSLPVQEWRFEVGAPDHGSRIDTFLCRHVKWRSRTSLQRALAERRVEILPFKNPQSASVGRLRPSRRLRRGQEVVVRLDAAYAESGDGLQAWSSADLTILYEDDHILAVDKPPHLSVYPSRRHRTGSLIEHVHARHREQNGESQYSPTLCHRLDRETSGLVLFAKDRIARANLSFQFEKREVNKTYLALVVGEMSTEKGRIELPIGPDRNSSVEIKKGVCRPPAGQPASTVWKVRRRLTGRTLVELRPETGRQHQLRVHMAAIGHPILGDKLYLGGDDLFLSCLEGTVIVEEDEILGLGRQALHAWRLELTHPATGEGLRLEAPLRSDISDLLGDRAVG